MAKEHAIAIKDSAVENTLLFKTYLAALLAPYAIVLRDNFFAVQVVIGEKMGAMKIVLNENWEGVKEQMAEQRDAFLQRAEKFSTFCGEQKNIAKEKFKITYAAALEDFKKKREEALRSYEAVKVALGGGNSTEA